MEPMLDLKDLIEENYSESEALTISSNWSG